MLDRKFCNSRPAAVICFDLLDVANSKEHSIGDTYLVKILLAATIRRCRVAITLLLAAYIGLAMV